MQGYGLQWQQAVISESMTNEVLQQVRENQRMCVTGVSGNKASYENFWVESSLAAFVIFRGHYEVSPYALPMLSVQMRLRPAPWAIEPLPRHSIPSSRTSHLSHQSRRLGLPIAVASICQASSTVVEDPSCNAVVPFWRLCPSPSLVHHLCSACTDLYLLHHHPHLPHPHHHQKLQDCSGYIQCHSNPPQMLFRALWLSLPPPQHFSYLAAPA